MSRVGENVDNIHALWLFAVNSDNLPNKNNRLTLMVLELIKLYFCYRQPNSSC